MKWLKMTYLFIFVLLLTGCWDRLELEEQAYVIAIGLDKGEKGETVITYQIGNPQSGGGSTVGKSEKEPASEIITIKVNDLLAARDTANAKTTRHITFAHTTTLIVSEELARSDDFYSLLEAVIRDRQIRRDIFLIISREKASDFLRNNNPQLETRPHKYYDFITKRWQETVLVPVSTLTRFMTRTEGDAGLFLAVYGTAMTNIEKKPDNEDEYLAGEVPIEGGNPTQLMGAAIFKEGKMIGTFTGQQNRGSMMLRPTFVVDALYITLPDPLMEGKRITAKLMKKQKNQYKMALFQSIPEIHVTVPFILDIISIPSGIDYVENMENQKLLKAAIQKYWDDGFEKLVKTTQDEYGAEPFQWALEARKKFGTIKEYTQYDWMHTYPDMKVKIKSEVEFRGFGKQLTPPDFNRIRD